MDVQTNLPFFQAGLGDWMRHLLGKVLDIQGLQQWNVDAEHVFIHPEYNEAGM